MVPQVYDDHDVLDAHLLQLREQLLTTAFLVAIVVALEDAALRNVGVQTLLAPSLLIWIAAALADLMVFLLLL